MILLQVFLVALFEFQADVVVHDLAVPPLTVQPVNVPASQGVVLSFSAAFELDGAAHCGGDGVVAGLVVEASVPGGLSVTVYARHVYDRVILTVRHCQLHPSYSYRQDRPWRTYRPSWHAPEEFQHRSLLPLGCSLHAPAQLPC